MHVHLEGSSFTLRPQRLRDARTQVRAVRADPVLSSKMAEPPTTRQYVRDLLVRRAKARLLRHRLEDPSELVVTSTVDGAFLGVVLLQNIDLVNRRAEVGIWLVEAGRGSGVALEASRLLMDWAFGPLGLERLEIVTRTDNAPAIAITKRLGFEQEGLLRQRDVQDGRRTDVLLFSRLATDR